MTTQAKVPDIFVGQKKTLFTSAIGEDMSIVPPPSWLEWTVTGVIVVSLLILLRGFLPEWAILSIIFAAGIVAHLLLAKLYARHSMNKNRSVSGQRNESPPSNENMTMVPDQSLLDYWRRFLKDYPELTWVLFTHGTCVLVPSSTPNPKAEAIEHLKAFGPVEEGSQSAAMTVIEPMGLEDVVVGCHSPAIFVVVDSIFVEVGAGPLLHRAGIVGRTIRMFDSRSLSVTHV